MNRHAKAISGRLSLRHPQHTSLEILILTTESAPPNKDADATAIMAVFTAEPLMILTNPAKA